MAQNQVCKAQILEKEHTCNDEPKACFQYPALLPSHIRILELNPGKRQDPLTGTILHRTFLPDEDEIPEYDAISYCWGDQSQPDSITLAQEHHISMGQLPVGRNLAAALRALRDTQKTRKLWCDSICINQSDLDDRTAQVQVMHHIYYYAASVVMWLGPETPWSVLAMDTLRSCADLVESVTLDLAVLRQRFFFKDPANTEIMLRHGLSLTVYQRRAVENMLALDWHKRLWTHQEAVLANKLTSVMMLGYEEISWKDFHHAFSLVCFLKDVPRETVDNLVTYDDNVQRVGNRMLACTINKQKSNSWDEALYVTEHMEFSDDRDRIYAIRGLVEQDLAESIEVDYSRSLKEIFTSVCLDEIRRERNLDIMTLCNAATTPSWVADLDRKWGGLTLDSHAARDSEPAVNLIEPNVLEVAGIACDEIITEPQALPCKVLLETAAEFRQRILDSFLSLATEELLQDDAVLDQLIIMLTEGSVRDYSIEKLHPPEVHSLRSLESWRGKIRKWVKGDLDDVQDPWETDGAFIATLPMGGKSNGCAKTRRGTFVRVPMETHKGDRVAVFLGLRTSIVLRHQGAENSYSVIGAAYHPDFSATQAFLGDDFHGWERVWNRLMVMYGFYKEGNPIRYTDPRLDNIPLSDGFEERYLDTEPNVGRPFWGRDGHRDFSSKDPRMSEAALRARGVPLQKFRLI